MVLLKRKRAKAGAVITATELIPSKEDEVFD